MEAFLGTILTVGFNFPPNGWAQCQGQLLPINQNTALFSLFSTYYGGNGTTTFGLPDLRSRIPLGVGQGSGLQNYSIGMPTGTETTTLTVANMPMHTHQATFAPTTGSQNITIPAQTGPLNVALNVASGSGSVNPGAGTVLAAGTSTGKIYTAYPPASPATMTTLNAASITVSGTPAIPEQTVAVNTVTGGTVTNAVAGGNQGFTNLQPSLALNFIVALTGIYPSRQ
ncbi:phage tail protein [Methylobacterium sp. SyP6R]|uniref:phage tail protein n=1 Tax=Methylobacterium sp. SyP6R TaxID=2718876 RepID=UPI001F2B24B8|nr:tail fiber protein [Methylobacterium sp. SyP6R]MCF4124575.1 tail fiber protein [Methylobacterium sp. SyP6R]